MPLVCQVGFKPTSSILVQASVLETSPRSISSCGKGRHDPCVGVRAGVTLESRMAIELLNRGLDASGDVAGPNHRGGSHSRLF